MSGNLTLLSTNGASTVAGFGFAAGAAGFASLISEQSSRIDWDGLERSRVELENRVEENGVYSVCDGVVERIGWQNPGNHAQGFGYRIYVRDGFSGYEYVYGHMDPGGSNLSRGSYVRKGWYIGRYANPKNGRSSGPHVHLGKAPSGTLNWVNPGKVSPLKGPHRITAPYGSVDKMHTDPHEGVDFAY